MEKWIEEGVGGYCRDIEVSMKEEKWIRVEEKGGGIGVDLEEKEKK